MRAIAFYLPQFHPIPENDSWWGMGFTEWTNVAGARPVYRGHRQPRLPADLGFYDLRLHETRQAQADLASEHGLSGFCYYHYWFNGRRLLERPFDDVLTSGRPDFPFCLCWANESWTRRWLGEDCEILLSQTYSDEDDRHHAEWLAGAFSDPRYLREDGRPIFLIYRPADLPSAKHTTDVIRQICESRGVGAPFLIGVDAHRPGKDFREDGFDATLVFEPQLGALDGAFDDGFSLRKLVRNLRLGVTNGRVKTYDYREARAKMNQRVRNFPTIPSVFVRWDNTPRRGGDGIVMVNCSPEAFAAALQSVICELTGSQLVFINAWNEWAEGNYLEPDQEYGLGYLEEMRRVLEEGSKEPRRSESQSAPLEVRP
jgi:lipopolysaccharide biosynthesis protein